ncbi:MAG: pirin family protein, partial [Gammaproteobacteria bacterium]|nr:pirin family protein [Gammaproteobacteria bacterium]
MINVRRGNERGHFKNDWLDSHHSFSFGSYYDPEHMGVSILRVINDDHIVPGGGFPTHSHRDMEIVSYVLEGELEHRDSMGNGSVIRPGEVQRMSAGTGVTHSEYNPSDRNGANFLQIWLLPNERGMKPGYAQQFFAPEERQGQLRLLVSQDGAAGSIAANTDAMLLGTLLNEDQQVTHEIRPDRMVYVHVASG